MKINIMLCAALLGFWLVASCPAQTDVTDLPPAPTETAEQVEHVPAYPHPTLPAEGELWTGPMLIIVAGMFLAAAIVGPLHRMEMPPEQPDVHAAHGHDDHGHH